MATIRSVWTKPVALVGLLLLAMAPGIASATMCGPEEDTTIESRWTGVYDTKCYGACDEPTGVTPSEPSSAAGWKIEMETVEETRGTWYKVRIENGDKSTVLAGLASGSSMDGEDWGFEQGKSPLAKLGGAAAMGWMNEKMKTEVEFAGWTNDEKVPVEGRPDGGASGGQGAVPEPTAALLFGAGFALTAMRRRTVA